MSGDDCLPVCLVLRSVNNVTLVPALRCVKRQIIVNTFHTYERRQASTLDETLELKKFVTMDEEKLRQYALSHPC